MMHAWIFLRMLPEVLCEQNYSAEGKMKEHKGPLCTLMQKNEIKYHSQQKQSVFWAKAIKCVGLQDIFWTWLLC